MLEIKPIMNTASCEVLNFKTCCGLRAFDQNLEVLVTNRGPRALMVESVLDLLGPGLRRRETAVTPFGGRLVAPEETAAFYCQMDEDVWNKARILVVYDREGGAWPVEITPVEKGEG